MAKMIVVEDCGSCPRYGGGADKCLEKDIDLADYTLSGIHPYCPLRDTPVKNFVEFRKSALNEFKIIKNLLNSTTERNDIYQEVKKIIKNLDS